MNTCSVFEEVPPHPSFSLRMSSRARNGGGRERLQGGWDNNPQPAFQIIGWKWISLKESRYYWLFNITFLLPTKMGSWELISDTENLKSNKSLYFWVYLIFDHYNWNNHTWYTEHLLLDVKQFILKFIQKSFYQPLLTLESILPTAFQTRMHIRITRGYFF